MKIKKENRKILLHEDIHSSIVYTSDLSETHRRLNFYFYKDGVRHYFKANGKYTFDYNEILGHIIMKGLGLQTIKPTLATYFGEDEVFDGIITKDYIKNRENVEVFPINYLYQLYQSADFSSVETYMQLLNNFLNDKAKETGKTIVLNPETESILKNLCLFHFLTGQQDNFGRNFDIILQEENDVTRMSLAPFIDNSLIFYKMIFGSISEKEALENPKIANKKIFYHFMLDNSKKMYKRETLLEQLALEILKNDTLTTTFKKALKFDLKKEIKLFEKENKIVIPDSFKLNAEIYYYKAIKDLKKEFKNLLIHNKKKKRTKNSILKTEVNIEL